MKYIYVPLLSLFCCCYSLTGKAQQLIAPAGGESPGATWTIGEVIGSYYQTDDCVVIQGFLSYMDLVSSVGIESDEWQEKIMIGPSPIHDNLNVSVPPSFLLSNVHIGIYSLNGTLVQRINLLKSSSNYNVSFLTSGIYVIRVTDMNGQVLATKKIMKL